MKDCADEKLGVTEFAGMANALDPHLIKSPSPNMNKKGITTTRRKLQIYDILDQIIKEKLV